MFLFITLARDRGCNPDQHAAARPNFMQVIWDPRQRGTGRFVEDIVELQVHAHTPHAHAHGPFCEHTHTPHAHAHGTFCELSPLHAAGR